MSSTELYEFMTQKPENMVIVDVLSPEEYSQEHIPGAINIPLERLQEVALTQLSKNMRVVVYGGAHEQAASNRAAKLLEDMGFRRVADFDGGLVAWKRAGYKTEKPQEARV
jgi:rhodanese-related sulfurtransferase